MTPRIVAVDWSGAKTGSGRKIALAEARGGMLVGVERRLTRTDVIDRLVDYARDGDVIAGLDFGFSLPGWYLNERGATSARDYWRSLAHDEAADALLAACLHPFWGRKGKTKPNILNHFRQTETALAEIGPGPKSVFQIAGAGAVGTGSIRGMRELHRLSEEGFHVWPFDDPAFPLVVEIYPRTFYKHRLTKSQRVDRESYILRERGVPQELKAQASATEDTFDAAVSAIAMSLHAEELAALPRIGDPVLRLEGIIWWPGWREAHGC